METDFLKRREIAKQQMEERLQVMMEKHAIQCMNEQGEMKIRDNERARQARDEQKRLEQKLFEEKKRMEAQAFLEKKQQEEAYFERKRMEQQQFMERKQQEESFFK